MGGCSCVCTTPLNKPRKYREGVRVTKIDRRPITQETQQETDIVTTTQGPQLNKIELIRKIVDIVDNESLTSKQKNKQIDKILDAEFGELSADEIRETLMELRNRKNRKNWLQKAKK